MYCVMYCSLYQVLCFFLMYNLKHICKYITSKQYLVCIFCSGLQLDIRAGQHGPVSSHNIANTQSVWVAVSFLYVLMYVHRLHVLCCYSSLRCTDTDFFSLALSEVRSRPTGTGTVVSDCGLVFWLKLVLEQLAQRKRSLAQNMV